MKVFPGDLLASRDPFDKLIKLGKFEKFIMRLEKADSGNDIALKALVHC